MPAMTDTACDVWAPEAVRVLDRTATSAFGISGYELMNRAAEAVCAAATTRWPEARRWVVLCGAGNNAGDGYVIARLARRAGRDVQVCALADPAALAGDAALAFLEFAGEGGGVQPFAPAVLADADLVIDALLGIGLGRPVSGDFRAAIEAVNAAGRPVVAVDIPSGLDATTGLPAGVAVRADLTVTFVGRKLGLYLGEGPAYAGCIEFAALGIPPAVVGRAGLAAGPPLRLFGAGDLVLQLPRRPATAHKGLFGHVLVVGGNDGMSGAVRLAGEAALRAGAGLVTVATRPAHAALLPLVRPELMCHGIEGPADLAPLVARATVIAIGPGLGQDEWARGLLAAILEVPVPLVLDADALNLLAGSSRRRDDWILTPHPGEAGRLLGRSSVDVQRDRLGTLAALRERYAGTVVLKGHGTLVGGEGRAPWLIPTGNPGMATAGMGDVLTGVTAGLVAQTGAPGPDVAAAAAYVHGAAGDAAADAGQRGLIASDVLDRLRSCLNP
jgi:NAD(P)H-hydrate epimerase